MPTGVIYLPAGCLDASHPASATKFNASNVIHHFGKDHRQASGSDVASKTELIHVASYAGVLNGFKVGIDVSPTGGDKQFTVDLQKSTGGGAFASVLSAVVTIDSGKADRSVTLGTIAAASYAAGDIFRVVVTASGTTGSQGQGVNCEAFFQEQATS